MGKYQILHQDNWWWVMLGHACVYDASTKFECVEWAKANK